MAAFLNLTRCGDEKNKTSKCLVNIDNICAIQKANIHVDGGWKDGAYIETNGSSFYVHETVETIEMKLLVIL